jgi:3-hydroxyisobutyrate dehydrogenase
MTHTVSFVGLGAMGLNSARLLAAAKDIRLQAFDLRAEALQIITEAGGQACASAAEANREASHAVIFVVNGKQTEQVIFGDQGLHETAQPGLVIISCVTMMPEEAAALGERCKARGWTFIDAPVSGGMVGAAHGTLTIMAGGNRQKIDESRFIFDLMGNRLKVVGERPGQGAMVKAINQLLCGVHLAAAGEALALAEHAGLDKQAVFDVVSQSAAASWMLNDRGPRMVADEYDTVTSAVDIFVKDLGIVSDVARSLRFPAPIAATALQSFLGVSGRGMGKLDDAAVLRYYQGFAE